MQLVSVGSYKQTDAWLSKLNSSNVLSDLDRYGRLGLAALIKETPIDEGDTRNSWSYKVTKNSVEWHNSHVNNGVNIAIIIQYGHGTGTGGFVSGRDYINPALKPIFDKIAIDIGKKIKHG